MYLFLFIFIFFHNLPFLELFNTKPFNTQTSLVQFELGLTLIMKVLIFQQENTQHHRQIFKSKTPNHI
jgi:F0F1-type ATP synthase membrane subunit a